MHINKLIPSKDKFIHYSIWQSLAMLNFIIVYGSCNYYASLQDHHYKMYFDWELSIPHIPWMMIFYRSLDVLLVIVLFLLTKERIKQCAKAMMVSIYLAAPIFIFFPAKLGFTRLVEFESFELFYKVLYAIDLPFNLLPSMHVTYAAISIWAIIRDHGNTPFKVGLLWIWLLLICASIIFVHQHHILDIPSGLLLAFIVYKKFIKN